jgi:hypothetical protein
MADLATGLTANDLAAMAPVPQQTAGVARTGGTGNASLDAISAAIGKAGVSLPTKPTNATASASVDVATTATNALMQQTQESISAMERARAEQANVFVQQQEALVKEGVAKGVIAEGSQEIADRNRNIVNQTFKPVEVIITEIAREQAVAATKLEETLDKQRALREQPGVAGFFNRLFTGNDLTEEYNAVAQEYNNRASMQASLLASRENLAAHQIAMLDNQTPEQKAAALELVRTASDKLVQDSRLKQLDSEEQHYEAVRNAYAVSANAAAGEAGRQISLSHADFNAKVHAITAAADGAVRIAQLQELQNSLGGKLETDKRVEAAFNLSSGEGTKFMDRLQRADPEAAAAVMQRSYSGKAQNANALARAFMYMPPNQSTASLRVTANAVQEAEGKFEGFLLKAGLDNTAFSKLPVEQQMAKRKEFYSSAEGEIPPAMSDSTAAAIARSISTTVPTGVISIPVVLGADGKTVLRDAKAVKLMPTGELGKQLAVLEGDATAAFELAKAAVVADSRSPEEVAKELSNFYQNALTVEAAYRGQERSQFGIPHATTFPTDAKITNVWGNTRTIRLDAASYPRVLTALVEARTAAKGREGVAIMSGAGVAAKMGQTVDTNGSAQ